MAAQLKFIAQLAMDDFNQSWADGSTFFDITDFMYRVASTAAEFYQKAWNEKYAELRTDTRGGELVPFDEGMLMQQVLTIKDGKAELQRPVMSFVNDKSGAAYQEILPFKPIGIELERTNIHERWMLKYAPDVARIFWYPLLGNVYFYSRGLCNVQEAILLYIPAVMDGCGQPIEDALIPDGVADYARTATVAKMKELAAGRIIDKTNDGNPNSIIQTEINKNTLAG